MPPTILYTAFDVVPTAKGASTHIAAFVGGLVRAGYPVTLITAGEGNLPPRAADFGATHLRAPTHTGNFLKRTLVYINFVLSHLENTPPYDVIHTRSVWDAAHWPSVRRHLTHPRFIFEMNGLPSIELKHHYSRLPSRTLAKIRRMEQAALHAADRVITVSQVGADHLVGRGVPPEKIAVIPNGIDPALFFPDPAVQPAPEILYVGTLAAWQGLPTLIRALPMVRQQHPVRLRIVGAGKADRVAALAAEVARLGLTESVIFHGPAAHESVPALMRAAAVCVAPLRADDRNLSQGACPLKVLEYMACGRPVIASDLPIVREVTANGACVQLVPPDDPTALADGLIALLNDPIWAGELGRRAAEHARQHFTWAAAVEHLLGVYAGLNGR